MIGYDTVNKRNVAGAVSQLVLAVETIEGSERLPKVFEGSCCRYAPPLLVFGGNEARYQYLQ